MSVLLPLLLLPLKVVVLVPVQGTKLRTVKRVQKARGRGYVGGRRGQNRRKFELTLSRFMSLSVEVPVSPTQQFAHELLVSVLACTTGIAEAKVTAHNTGESMALTEHTTPANRRRTT